MEILIVFAALFGLVFGADDVLKLDQGKITGSVLKSRNGREFEAFQGIPFAKPPTGDLRFKAPVPADPWDGVLNATSEPPPCIQKNLFMYESYDKLLGKEDCLYLNVYTPEVPKKRKSKLLPVMAWIPGGGFSSGHGGLSLYGPHYLLDADVVVVSINYRVGILGFLSAEDDVLPGNYGMKDQVLALKWIKDNIAKFGGDPKRVTIFGESAGGASVGLHLLSPMSKGLFHKAILESGAPLCRWAVSPPGWAERRALALSTITGCPTESDKLVECLRLMPANQLASLHYNFFEWSVYPAITFMPVVESCEKKKESFLCKNPLQDFKQVSKVPVLMGMNSGEGGLFAARLYDKNGELAYPDLEEHFNQYASSLLIYKYTVKMSDIPVIGKKIYKRYFPDGRINDPIETVKMVSGGIFLQGVFDTATKLASPVYYYVYDHRNQKTYNSLFGPYPNDLGVTHGDEMISLFLTEGFPTLKGEDLKVSKLMIDVWTRFASADKLTIDGTKKGKRWPRFDARKTEYLLINSSTPVLADKPFLDEYTFWSGLPLLSGVSKESRGSTKTEL